MIWEWMLFYFIQTLLQITPELFLQVFGHGLDFWVLMLLQMSYIVFPWIGMLLDDGIKMGLGKLGIITLIVPMLSVTDHVNEDIAVELLAIAGGNFHALYNSFRIVAVHVHHRSLYHGCQ